MRALAVALVCLSLTACGATMPGVPRPRPAEQGPDLSNLGEPLHATQTTCANGSRVHVRLYDSNPADPNAALVVFSRDGVAVAVLESATGQAARVWIVADKRWYTEDAIPYSDACVVPLPV